MMQRLLSPLSCISLAITLALAVTMAPRLTPSAAQDAKAVHAHVQLSSMQLPATDLGRVAATTPLSILLLLRDPHAGQLANDVGAMYTPHAARYGRFLTASEVAARYGPSPAVLAQVRKALKGLGLFADWQPGNDWLIASGPAARVEAAFAVQAHWYRSAQGIRFYAGNRPPRVPAVLRPYVASMGDLSSYFEPSHYKVPASVPANGLAPADLLGVYDITPLRNLGLDGTGQTVVFFELDGFSQSDFNTFTQKYGLPPLQPEIKAGPTLAAGSETEMDLEIVHEIAPGAKLVLYNFDNQAASQQAGNDTAKYLQLNLDLQSQMVKDNPGAVISQSVGMCEKPLGQAIAAAYKNLYDQADALGESVFVSTGDNAAYECLRLLQRGTPPGPSNLTIPLPADAPGVTAVGGTRVSESQNQGWYNETVWEYPAETNGTGGGVSLYYSRPSWQQGPGVQDPTYNPHNMRSIPDVAADADPLSGAALYLPGGNGGGAWTTGGGTSQAAPIWAGITALINQYLQQKGLKPVGFMNPALYAIAANPNPYVAFHDITMGSNLYYPATAGYDMASGLGTPDVWNLARDLEVYQRGGGQ